MSQFWEGSACFVKMIFEFNTTHITLQCYDTSIMTSILNQAHFISWTPIPVYYRFLLPYCFFAQYIYTKKPNKSLNTNLTFQSLFASVDLADGLLCKVFWLVLTAGSET